MLFFPGEARPCSCSWPPIVLDEFEHVENVIVAKVTDVKDRGEAESNLFSVTTVMTIVKVYKGGFKSGEEVEFISSGTSCDYQFHPFSSRCRAITADIAFTANSDVMRSDI